MTEKIRLMLRKGLDDKQTKWMMLFLFIASVIIRYLLSSYDRSYVIFGDECLYWNQARSLATGTELSVRGMEKSSYIILYQWLLSIIMRIISSTQMQMQMIALLNALLTSSIVLWIFKIGKALKLKNGFILLAAVILLTMPDYSMTVSVMTENLYFPVTAALFYLELRVIQSKTRKEAIFRGAFLGLMFAVARLTRDIALCLVLSYALCGLLFCLFCMRKEGWKKEILLEHAIHIGVPLGCYYVCYAVVSSWIPNPDVSNVLESASLVETVIGWLNPESMPLLIHSFLHNLVYSLIAVFFFPVVLPLLYGDAIKEEEKKWFWNIILGFLTVLGISTLLVERSGTLLYQKLRYIFYFMVPFLMMFLLLFQRRKSLCFEKRGRRICLGCTLVFVALVVGYFRLITYGSQADHSLLEYLSVIGVAIGDKSYKIGNTEIYAADICLKILWVSVPALGFWLLKRNKKSFFLISCCTMIGLNLFNYWKCTEMYKEVWEVPDQKLQELEKLNNCVNSLDGDVLVIIHDFNLSAEPGARIDTYMERELYFAGEENLLALAEEKGYVDLETDFQYIMNSKNSYTYIHPFEADYIVLADPFAALDNAREIKTDLKGFSVYQNLDPKRIYIQGYSFFPEEKGKTHTFTSQDYVFESNYISEEGEYRSTGEEDYLFYGPYIPVKKGVYKIKVNYRYTGEQKEGMIGNLDVNLQIDPPDRFLKSTHLYEDAAIFAENTSSEMEVVVGTDVYKAELRLYTFVEGVVFDSVEITKLADTEAEWKQIRDTLDEGKGKAVFPEKIGETCRVTAEDAVFVSGYFHHGTYRSTEVRDYLFYGPYVNAKKGIYKIKVNYEYYGDLKEGKIGNLDVNMKGDYQYNNVEIDAGKKSGEMEVVLNGDVTEAEIRLFTYGADVVFKSVEVTRVGDLYEE